MPLATRCTVWRPMYNQMISLTLAPLLVKCVLDKCT
jgi:hypothetical protein